MAFNAALSGLRSASTDLKVTGNNIANASTVGFKASRAEFGDVYAASVLGSGSAQTGGGSRVQDIAQQFAQGNISFTSSQLDLAISGQGFFMLEQNDSRVYSRAGSFSIDDQGFIVNNSGAKLQGFAADSIGNFSGVPSDIQIETGNQAPKQTTGVESSLNLDASESVLQRNGVTFASTGSAIAEPNKGAEQSQPTEITGQAVVTFPLDIQTNPISFDVDLNGDTVTVSLDDITTGGVTTITSMSDLVDLINTQLLTPKAVLTQESIPVFAEADQAGTSLKFITVDEGDNQVLTVDNVNANIADIGFAVNGTGTYGTIDQGITAVSNGYPEQSFTVLSPNGNEITYTSAAGLSAAESASGINDLAGISASALTQATILASTFDNGVGALIINLNDQPLTSNSLTDIVDEINGYSNSTLPGISAELNAAGDLVLTSIVGDDLRISVEGGAGAIEVQSGDAGLTQTLDAANVADNGQSIVVGGVIDVVVEEGYAVKDLNPVFSGLFTELAIRNADPFTINAFSPDDPATYNHSTSLSIFDSLGESHIMTQYFVKQEFDPNNPAVNEPNVWKMYVQIDGQDVGDPDTSLSPPLNTLATRAEFTLRFNPDGSLDNESSSELLISNWTPLTADGTTSGALGPLNRLEGGGIPVEDPATSSNFEIDMGSTTQFSSAFAVNSVDQNGYTTGLLTGIDITDEGIIFARFTNGESVALSQLALANFENPQGLQPLGDSVWAENFESGEALIGGAGSGSLGLVQAGALEESNVDLSEQLVNLIIAQRNFQANAKTIETANQITQTIINLR
jgi:flagellar hook protein FlgE